MIHAFNLSNNNAASFSDCCSELWVVVFSWAQDHNRTSEALTLLQTDRIDIDTLLSKGYPITLGKASIACGDWATMLSAK